MLNPTDDGEGHLVPCKSGMFGRGKPVTFDVALLAFHGNQGEDGQIQGLFEMMGVPYTGMRTMASAALMDKSVTKRLLAGQDIPQLDCAQSNCGMSWPANKRLVTDLSIRAAEAIVRMPV